MAGTVSEVNFDSVDVSSFEVSPGSGSDPTVIVVVGRGHPRPVALSLGMEALFNFTSAAFAACEKVDRPRIAAVMIKIASAYAPPALPAERKVEAAGDAQSALIASGAARSHIDDAFKSVMDEVADLQRMCRERGISDVVTASLLKSMIDGGIADLPSKRIAVSGAVKDGDEDEESKK